MNKTQKCSLSLYLMYILEEKLLLWYMDKVVPIMKSPAQNLSLALYLVCTPLHLQLCIVLESTGSGDECTVLLPAAFNLSHLSEFYLSDASSTITMLSQLRTRVQNSYSNSRIADHLSGTTGIRTTNQIVE